MWQQRWSILSENKMWVRALSVMAALFFIFLSDAIMSYFVPVFVEGVVGSALVMGLVMGFSSLVGIGADLILPQVARSFKTKLLYSLAVGVAVTFVGLIWWASIMPLIVVILIAMGLWGIYYELLSFGDQQFVAELAGKADRPKVWSVLRAFISLAYVLGPLLAVWLLGVSQPVMLLGAVVMAVFGFVLLVILHKQRNVRDVEYYEVNLRAEVSHWRVLFEHVWPVIVMGMMIGLIDASYWSVGAVLTSKLAKQSWLGGLWLPLYMVPFLFMGGVVIRWGVHEHKKRWGQIFLLVGGVILALVGLTNYLWLRLVFVFVSACCFALALPLIDATYTDLVARMGRERKHLIGLTSSSGSFAYVVGPVMAGGLAQMFGDVEMFALVGAGVVVVSLVLLVVTPRKLKLPQEEIGVWEKEEEG